MKEGEEKEGQIEGEDASKERRHSKEQWHFFLHPQLLVLVLAEARGTWQSLNSIKFPSILPPDILSLVKSLPFCLSAPLQQGISTIKARALFAFYFGVYFLLFVSNLAFEKLGVCAVYSFPMTDFQDFFLCFGALKHHYIRYMHLFISWTYFHLFCSVLLRILNGWFSIKIIFNNFMAHSYRCCILSFWKIKLK